MKRLFGLAAALTLTLTACSSPAGSAGTAIADVPGTVGIPAQAPAAAMHRLTDTWSISPGAQGYYHVYRPNYESGLGFAAMIDLQTGQDQILCTKPGCTHTDESCPALVAAPTQDNSYPSVEILVDGDLLYRVSRPGLQQFSDKDDAFIDVSGLDSTDRRRIAAGGTIPVYMDSQWYGNGESLFNTYRCGGYFAVYRFDDTGAKALYERQTEQQALTEVIGAWQDRLVLLSRADYATAEMPGDGATEQEWSEWDAANNAARQNAAVSIQLLAADGTLTDTGLTLPTDVCWAFPISGDSLYAIDEAHTVYRYDLAACTLVETTVLPAFADRYDMYGTIWGTWVRGSKYVGDDYIDIWLDLATGEYLEPQASWLKDEMTPRAPFVVSAVGDTLLVQTGSIPYTDTITGQDGQVSSYTTSRYTYGLISAEAFFGGSQDWTPVTLLGNDLV